MIVLPHLFNQMLPLCLFLNKCIDVCFNMFLTVGNDVRGDESSH